MKRRLHLQIFGALVLTGVVCVLVAVTLGRLLRDDNESLPRMVQDIAGFVVADMPEQDPALFERELRRRARKLHASISVWDKDGRLLASAGRRLVPPEPRLRGRLFDHAQGAVTVALEDGRTLSLSFDRAPRGLFGPPHFVTAVLMLLCVLLFGSHWAARRIARRLEALERSVQRFGEGELTARADECGRDEIARLASAFNRSSARIAGLLKQQRRMLQSASHELRSPLARLRMAFELAADEGLGAGERERIRSEAARDIEELDALIADLLLAGRLTDTELPKDFAEVELGSIVRGEAERVRASADARPFVLKGNQRMLTSLVRNLLENARRYGKDPITITLRREDHQAVLWVDDAGPGVPEADRERIFEPFYRPEGHREASGGVGLGLSLVRSIAEHHGGTVRYVARAGGGSRFEVRLMAP